MTYIAFVFFAEVFDAEIGSHLYFGCTSELYLRSWLISVQWFAILEPVQRWLGNTFGTRLRFEFSEIMNGQILRELDEVRFLG